MIRRWWQRLISRGLRRPERRRMWTGPWWRRMVYHGLRRQEALIPPVPREFAPDLTTEIAIRSAQRDLAARIEALRLAARVQGAAERED